MPRIPPGALVTSPNCYPHIEIEACLVTLTAYILAISSNGLSMSYTIFFVFRGLISKHHAYSTSSGEYHEMRYVFPALEQLLPAASASWLSVLVAFSAPRTHRAALPEPVCIANPHGKILRSLSWPIITGGPFIGGETDRCEAVEEERNAPLLSNSHRLHRFRCSLSPALGGR